MVFFSLIFSVLFCFLCLVVDSLIGFWMFLELVGVSIIPVFFCSYGGNVYGFYSSLLTYIVVSSISSVLLVCGILFVSLYSFVLFGFFIKFGLFPFMFWVYRLFVESNWVFIFFFSVVLKFPVLFFVFLFQGFDMSFVFFDCGLTILVCSFVFWFFSVGYEFIWCHVSLSSVSALLVVCFCSDLYMSVYVYMFYFVWSFLCIWYFYYCVVEDNFVGKFWVFCFLLLVTPISLPLFYKLSVCVGIFYSSIYVLVLWSFYSFSEQFFFYKLASSNFYSDVYNFWVL